MGFIAVDFKFLWGPYITASLGARFAHDRDGEWRDCFNGAVRQLTAIRPGIKMLNVNAVTRPVPGME